MRKITSFMLALFLTLTFFTYSFDSVLTANAISVNDSTVFVKQSRSGRCTLASAVMMLRRRAIIDGVNDWDKITEEATENIAWTTAGLYNNFTFAGMTVGYAEFLGTAEEKKEKLINLLKNHPEGIEVYNRDTEKMHAVLVTDYDAKKDVFYCADPAGGIPSGRILLTQAWLPGETQDERLENLDFYWYITNKSGGVVSISDYVTTNSISATASVVNGIISNPGKTLKYGDLNNTVKELQLALNKVMGSGLDVDGQFGNATETAVKNFQKEYDLETDGIAGPATLMALNELYGEHTHKFSKDFEKAHPHKEYKACDCGYFDYTGKCFEIDSCQYCVSGVKSNQIVFTVGKSTVNVFGKEVNGDTAPQIVNDRTMLPARILAESFGATIDWMPGESGRIIISTDDTNVYLHIGASAAYVNGRSVALDSPAYIYNDRVYLPVRFLADVFGASVEWNSEAKQVVITKN